MAEVKKKSNKKAANTSKVHKVSKKKIEASNLSSDELLEQILNKKKTKALKKDVKSTNVENKNSDKKNQNVKVEKDLSQLSNDELYDLIKSKKKSKKKQESDVKKIETTEKVETLEEQGQKNDDLIITREITFTESSLDLKDKKLLKELRQAIEDYDALSDTCVEKKFKEEPIVETKKVDRKSFKFKLFILIFLFILCLVVVLLLAFNNNDDKDTKEKVDKTTEKEVVDLKPQLYEECLNRPISESDNSDEVLLEIDELTSYLEKEYDVSLIYEDLNLGFKYSYNTDEVYYGASVIKALDALYIYTKAAAGEINLDDKMTYSSKYKWSSSREMSKYKYGDEVTIRDLVKYAVTVSDNSAHQMLVSYIGRHNLKSFGNSLGATTTLTGNSDNFGNISATDALIYMKEINKFINENEELGEELKSYFVVADQNGLEFPDLGIQAAHKYGEYKYYYHDIGIVYDKNPYIITILTLEGNKNFVEIIKDINSRIYELHNLYYSNREKVCKLEIYGE